MGRSAGNQVPDRVSMIEPSFAAIRQPALDIRELNAPKGVRTLAAGPVIEKNHALASAAHAALFPHPCRRCTFAVPVRGPNEENAQM
jgi:hypothetical protein